MNLQGSLSFPLFDRRPKYGEAVVDVFLRVNVHLGHVSHAHIRDLPPMFSGS